MPNNRNLIDCLLSLQSSHHGVYFTLNSGPDDFLSYKDLINSARSVLVHLHDKGLKKGDELVFQFNNPINFIVTFWSCLFGGIVPVPVSVSSSSEGRNKLIRILKELRDPWIITDENSTEIQGSKNVPVISISEIGSNHIFFQEVSCDPGNLAEIESVDAEDIAFIQFSSGSTGLPKGAVLTHRNLLTNLNAITQALKMRENTDPTCCWTPLTHDMGIVGGHLLSIYSYNNQNIISTNCFLKNPSVWLQKMSQYKITISSAPNFGFYYTTKYARHSTLDQIDLSLVRHILNGAEPVSYKVCDTFNEKFQKYGLKKNAILPVYGMAEACLAVAFPELNTPIESWFINRNSLTKGQKAEFTKNKNDACFVSVGKAVNGCSIKISHKDKTLEGDRIIGEILIKGDNVIRHYYGKSERATDKEGWFNTGDLGFIVDGKLVITGRLKDIIFWNGQNVYPHDLERIAEQLEIVGAGKIVFGGNHRHDSGLEEVLAFLQYRGNIQSFMPIVKEIRKQISEKTGIQIKYVIPVRKIPKTTSGKIQRYLLVSGYQNGDYNDVTEQMDALHSMGHLEQAISCDDLLEAQLTSIWEEVLEISPIDVHDNFFELGGDSIKAIRIGTKLQEHKFNCPPSMLFEKKTIKEMAEFIRSYPESSEQVSDDDKNQEISEYSVNQFSNEDLEDVFSKK